MSIKGILLLASSLLLWSGGTAEAESCISGSCHASFADHPHAHQPVTDGECRSCHVAVAVEHPGKGVKSFELAEQGAALCFQCHDALGKGRVVHAPVAEGDCLACHQVHGGANPYLLASGQDQSDLCFTCHDDAPFRQMYQHGPAAVGACGQCHDPHESIGKGLLRAPVRELCLNCHQDFARQLATAPVVHAPVKNSPCTDCHHPHAAKSPFILATAMPELCFSCHPDVGEAVAGAKVRHQPIDQAASCGSCHSTHFSAARGLLPTEEKNLCLRCHGVDDLGSPPLKNIQKELDGKKYLHEPIRQGKCGSCHNPHGSAFSRLLTGPYPEELYLPYQQGAYDFCLQCHEKNLLRFAETTLYTRFRNGNRNLHFVHVSDPRKGRSCGFCHEAHGGDGERLISKEGKPFGRWRVPIRFEKTATGGGCAPGCHAPFNYDREKPLDYPSARN